jgi:hypothetical protein
MARYSNTAGQKEAPKAEAKSTKNTFKADDAPSKGTKVKPFEAKTTPAPKQGVEGKWGGGRDSKITSSPDSGAGTKFAAAAKEMASKAPEPTKVVKKDVTKVVSKAPAKPAQETAASRASRQAAYDDWKSSQKALGAPGMKKGGTAKKKMACGGKAYAKGGLVKSSKAINGCASKGLTKGASR